MSTLTQGAKDLQAAEERLKTGNGLTDWLIDRVAESVQPDGRGGSKTTGGWGWVGDRVGLNSTEIRERRTATDDRISVDSAIGRTGRTRQQLEGALGRPITTADDATAALAEFNDDQVIEAEDRAGERQSTQRDEAQSDALEILAIQNGQADKRAAETNRLALAQMALSNTQTNNQFAIAQMNNQLQMRREDAREARLERKDRQASIQQLMAGLAQMGASIAI